MKIAQYGYSFLETFSKQKHYKGYLVRAVQEQPAIQAPQEGDSKEPEAAAPQEAFTEFSPFLFEHMKDKDLLVMDDYGLAVDKYFGSITIKKSEKEQIEDKA